MYKNYIFDLYGTLADINTNESKRYLWEKTAEIYAFNGALYTPSELKKEYFRLVKEEKENVKREHPHFTNIDVQLDKVFAQLYKNKGIEPESSLALLTAQFFRAVSTKYIRLYDGAMDLLLSLKQNGKSVYLLTNAQRCFTVPELKMLGIYDKFDGIVISSDELTCKPDKAFYNKITERFALDKNESIMIGNDFITDIEGAYNAGLNSLYIHSNLSPDIKGELKATYSIMDGDVKKVKELILKS
ncbi:MAG: HAD family hydrolase [Acutalibacteraceae bacterium]